MKYIILEAGGLELPVLFPDLLVHSDVADAITETAVLGNPVSVIAAGFVSFGPYGPECSGYSESLGLGSRGVKDRAALIVAGVR